ncbi:unnamed protein product [marine sediment metagenome]|uniref:Uncharacterized protein n=1 Tax=marine sediment metagenome TaxID=412755 RepID=X1RZ28_9ZZZZ
MIFGYGSLMSYRGLLRSIKERINLLDAIRVQIKGKRGFAKPTFNKICMDVDDFVLKGSIIKNKAEQGYIEGLIVKITQRDFPDFCSREGYTGGNKLITYSSNFNSVGEALWKLFQESIKNDYYKSIRNYRMKLKDKLDYTSKHYIPHPLVIKNLGYAIMFIAPGKYGTGNGNLKSRKNEENISYFMDINEVLKRADVNKNEFLTYTLECLYGGVHGINVKDIIDLISVNSEFFNEVKKKFNEELIIKEKVQFANCIFGSLDNYKQKFGNFEQNLSRSGLKSMIDYDD